MGIFQVLGCAIVWTKYIVFRPLFAQISGNCSDVSTFHIHITGQVQGVGFRPFVYQQAVAFGLSGWVLNAADGVHIEFNADPAKAEAFIKLFCNRRPAWPASPDIGWRKSKCGPIAIFPSGRATPKLR